MARAASVCRISGRTRRNSSHGTIASVRNPGTIDPEQPSPPGKFDVPDLARELRDQRIGRHPGEEHRRGGISRVEGDQHQERPDLRAVGPGSEPKALATERVMGKTTPPPRAVSDGMKGASTRSAAASEYPRRKGVRPKRSMNW